jgi:hypothetical protein
VSRWDIVVDKIESSVNAQSPPTGVRAQSESTRHCTQGGRLCEAQLGGFAQPCIFGRYSQVSDRGDSLVIGADMHIPIRAIKEKEGQAIVSPRVDFATEIK